MTHPIVHVAWMLIAAVVSVGLPIHGQDVPDVPEPQSFTATTNVVVLHVNVKGSRGQHVPSLPATAFTVMEDGRSQTVSFFSDEDLPATVGLLVDSSTSMWSIRDRVIAAGDAFARASHREDELFALAFNDDVRPALPLEQPFTGDATVLRSALDRAVSAQGRTALFDAVSSGIAYATKGSHQRKALILISDGGDNASAATAEAVLRKTQASNVVIYTVALLDPLSHDSNPKLLRQLAQESGGNAFEPASIRDLSDVLQTIAVDIRQSYTLGYTPTTAPDGRYHRIRVTVSAPDRGRLTARVRAGYLAGSPSEGSSHD